MRCGIRNPLPDGSPAQCDPDGNNPCCNDKAFSGKCGNTTDHCLCNDCVDYRIIYKDWRESNGRQKWRYDGTCGELFPLPDGTPSECDPDSELSCCEGGHCVRRSKTKLCNCHSCVDYALVKKIRENGQICKVLRVNSGFLKNACFDEKRKQISYKCTNSDVHYRSLLSKGRPYFSEICDDDRHTYQVCGFGTPITNTEVLCGGFICESVEKQYNDLYHKYIECAEDDCRTENRDCSESGEVSTVCDGKCDTFWDCEDESYCNGYTYGLICNTIHFGREYLGVSRVCNDVLSCQDGSDERDCSITDDSGHYCAKYYNFVEYNKTRIIVPILNYTRCSVFDVSPSLRSFPYCLDYLDQTNCTDIERVGGYCLVGGFLTSVSKFAVCYHFDSLTQLPVKICDDDLQNECLSDISGNCVVHKHRMCDGVNDCPDASDEFHESCWTIKRKEFEFNCTRRFNLEYGNGSFPAAWIMDSLVDCMDGEDENEDSKKWQFCRGEFQQILLPGQYCQNAFKCPGSQKSYVPLHQLCDGVESCGDVGENEVCRVARDFPVTITTVPYKDIMIRDVCQNHSENCEIREFYGLWGKIEVFGMATKNTFMVPTSKTNCSKLFGEEYLFLSCMDLCSEADVKCPLDDMTGVLKYNSCPGQFPDRTYTIANNSFMVFLENSDKGHYHQEFYECKNSRCVEYKQVCDLVDDCGDMSDEINCINHMICEDTLNSTKHQFIALSQKCDGIYDCFDLSDECNDACGREILENWALKIICWFMGTLALLFNFFTMTQEFASTKECRTENMLTSRVLMGWIGLGDCLIGLYLVILSIYDSIIMGNDFCVRQAEWLTGKACLTLGVISTFGSQISLFTMTILSFIRMYGLIFKPMRVAGPVNKKAVLRVVLLSMATITVALSIAVVPLAPFLDDYFVQGMYYDPAYKVFVGFPNKERHIKILQTYENVTRNATTISTDMSWEEIGISVDKMFSQDHGTLSRIPVHFYGNDGLCLFKFFVRTDDARRSRQPEAAALTRGDPVVWAILAVNFFCFLIITCCYIVINIQTKKSSKRSGQKSDRNRLKNERAIQNKIMIMIATDFLCWVPFILVSALHSLETIDASKWYASFSMTVLPLNSVINPLVYDKALGDFITGRFAKLRSFIRGLLNMSDEDQEQENIPIETICSNLTMRNPTVTSADAVEVTGGSPQQDCEETM